MAKMVEKLAVDLSVKDLKFRRWRHPRIWKNGEKIIFKDFIVSEDGIVILYSKRIPKKHNGRTYEIKRNRGNFAHIYLARGYPIVTLLRNGKSLRVYLHKLVYETWMGRIPYGMEINHIDGNKENPHVVNLEVITSKENKAHARKMGLAYTSEQRKKISEVHKGRKLSKEHKEKIGIASIKMWETRSRSFSKETRRKMSEFAKTRIGERNSNAKLTQEIVDKLRFQKFKQGLSISEMRKIFPGKDIPLTTLRRAVFGGSFNSKKLSIPELEREYGN